MSSIAHQQIIRNCGAVAAAGLSLVAVARADLIDQTPQAFLRRAYAPYFAEGANGSINNPAIFTTDLWYLIQRDRLRTPGDEGYLTDDPFCACQDNDPFTSWRAVITTRTQDTARASVSFVDGTDHETVGFSLVLTSAGWRVADIANPYRPSLFAFLKSHP